VSRAQAVKARKYLQIKLEWCPELFDFSTAMM
jgi:hypothetical protein